MITQNDVKKIAQLSRLEIHSHELDLFTNQMNNILNFIAKLNELDTSQIEPTSHAISVSTPFREDKAVQSKIREKALEIAPESEDHFFRVPKVI